MDHNDIRHKLSEYMDGSITAEEKTKIEEHLKTCQQCSDALRELQKTVEHIRSIEEVEPPAWMTQKIMTKVRTGSEKKGLFQRFFFPLSTKLPAQAIAVLFLAVTAIYIYRNIQPASVPSEAPVQEFAVRSEVPPAPALRNKREEPNITKDASVPAKKVPQAPEYKALDMKQEYEKPAPPVALGKAAESAPGAAPAKPEEQPKQSDESLRGQSAQTPAGDSTDTTQGETLRTSRQERAEPSAELRSAEKMAKTPAPAPQARAMPTAEEPKKLKISLSAPDTARAAHDIEKIVTQLGGRIVEKTGDAGTSVITVSLGSGKLKELNARLRSVGELKDKEMLSLDHRGTLQIEIVILKTSPRP